MVAGRLIALNHVFFVSVKMNQRRSGAQYGARCKGSDDGGKQM